VLEPARQAVSAGNFASALGSIAAHERRFPHGRLAEEREALRVKALRGLGRADDARRAAAEFRQQFPRSVLSSQMGEPPPAAP
jgi:outer membrane protein assembly factor BamD (BamD/ComL family)